MEQGRLQTIASTHALSYLPCVTLYLCPCASQETKETTWQRPGTAPAKDSAGNVYDDESEQDDGPGFSDSMRQKMIDESRGLGGDPNQKNPFLLVFAGIGLFVVAGALSSGI